MVTSKPGVGNQAVSLVSQAGNGLLHSDVFADCMPLFADYMPLFADYMPLFADHMPLCNKHRTGLYITITKENGVDRLSSSYNAAQLLRLPNH